MKNSQDQGRGLIHLSLGQYTKASDWDFPVMTSLSVNKWYLIHGLGFFIC